MEPTKPVTVGGCLWRLATGAVVGAVLTPPALFLWLLAHNPRLAGPTGPFGGLIDNLLTAVVGGPILGLFAGAVGGWIWLVVAVGRESRHAIREPHDTPQANGVRERLPPDSPHANQDA